MYLFPGPLENPIYLKLLPFDEAQLAEDATRRPARSPRLSAALHGDRMTEKQGDRVTLENGARRRPNASSQNAAYPIVTNPHNSVKALVLALVPSNREMDGNLSRRTYYWGGRGRLVDALPRIDRFVFHRGRSASMQPPPEEGFLETSLSFRTY